MKYSRIKNQMFKFVCLWLVLLMSPLAWADYVRGIYLTQPTLQNTQKLNYLIQRAKKTGINTFIIDLNRVTEKYKRNIALVHAHGIHYVVRIVVFPDGGKPWQVHSTEYRQQKYRLIQQAIDLGAREIQLDYIRYSSKQPKSRQNAQDIYEVIKWYKKRVARYDIPLQIAVFGVTSFGESPHIGQNIQLFSDSIDTLAPMLYPSHFEPFEQTSARPYETVYDALLAIQEQFYDLPFRLVPYIEMYNYRYPLSRQEKRDYIYAQIKAAEHAGSHGWYAWSANNFYAQLFYVLENYDVH